MSTFPKLTQDMLGQQVPKRHGKLAPKIAKLILKAVGWKVTGSIPNIPQAVVLCVPHTSNIDGVYAIPTILALDLNIKIMGKKELFDVPVLKQFITWAGIIPIDRSKKGSVLQASIDEFKTGKPLFLGLAPEGTRQYSDSWKTGFYYIAEGAGVPIIPVRMDYGTKEIRFMEPVYPTGDIDADMKVILAKYKGVVPCVPSKLSKPLQDINNS